MLQEYEEDQRSVLCDLKEGIFSSHLHFVTVGSRLSFLSFVTWRITYFFSSCLISWSCDAIFSHCWCWSFLITKEMIFEQCLTASHIAFDYSSVVGDLFVVSQKEASDLRWINHPAKGHLMYSVNHLYRKVTIFPSSTSLRWFLWTSSR